MEVSLMHVFLSGTGITVLAGFLKYVIDTMRQHHKEGDPFVVATASTTVMRGAMDSLRSLNDDIIEENARIRALLIASEARRLDEQRAYEERERHLKAKIEELEKRVRDLDEYVAALSADIQEFREREFPPVT